jgi:dienelactone hydrolase
MKPTLRLVATILLGCLCGSYAANGQPWQKEFYPPSGKGRATVVVSGHTGPGNYAYFAKDLAAQGYYVVLVDGNDFFTKALSKNDVGRNQLRGVILRAQQSPHALPGKVAVVGFFQGGSGRNRSQP